MEIRGIKGQMGPGQVAAGKSYQQQQGLSSPAASENADRVQISPVARYLEQYSNMPAVRADKVAQAREDLAAGTLDSDAKLSVAIDRLLDDLLGS